MKKEITIDGRTINSPQQFHQEIAALLSFPHYYRGDLDDLWTCLTSYIDPRLRLLIRDMDHLCRVFGPEASGFQDVFERLPDACPDIELVILR